MLRVAHVAAFALASGGCFLAVWQVRDLPHAETRYGLYGLCATSGLWALGQLVTFLDVSLPVARVAYQIGLVAGLATIGAWLYFCSAYTGQTYHRRPLYRRTALGAFLGISLLKLTNAIHGQYFTVERVTAPFPHAGVQLLELHYGVTVLAYSLTAVGFYMLFQLFIDSEIRTTGLAALVSLTAVPVVLDVLGQLAVPGLVASNYEPLGVAAFAVGTLYLAEDTLEQVRWTSHQQIIDRIDEGIIVVSDDHVICDYNEAAGRIFPDLTTGTRLDGNITGAVSSHDVSDSPAWADGSGILEREQEGGRRYYLVNNTDLTIGPHRVGRALVVTDVTTVENQRRELERQSEQLDGFAAAVAHELRNMLTIADSNLTLVSEAIGSGDIEEARATIGKVNDANQRMTDIVGDLTTLARLSQTVTDPPTVQFGPTVRGAYAAVDSGDLTLTVEGDGEVRADETRLSELVRNATQLAAKTGASTLRVTLAAGEIRLWIDSDAIAECDLDRLLEYGTAVPHAEAGMLGPNIRTLAWAHGWEVSAVHEGEEGVLIVITGVTVDRLEPGTAGS